MKKYTKEQLVKKFDKMTKDDKIEALCYAIDFMQQYNGRTKWECVFRSMGYIFTEEGDTDDMYWVKND